MANLSNPSLLNLWLCLWTPAILRIPALWNISPVRISTWRGETGRFTSVLWSVGLSIPALMSEGVAPQKGQRACQVLPSWQFIIFPRVCEIMSCKEEPFFQNMYCTCMSHPGYTPFRHGTFWQESFRHGTIWQESFRHRYFIMGTFRLMHHLALRTFWQTDESTQERFNKGIFCHGEYSAQGIFGTGIFRYGDISAR